jgi:hypothetical protein
LIWLFWSWDLMNYFLRLALNCDPPNLRLPRSLDYGHEPLVSGTSRFLNTMRTRSKCNLHSN